MEKWWPTITNKASALAAAKSGSIGGFIFMAMYSVAIIALLITGRNIVYGDSADSGTMIEELFYIGITVALVAFWTWRIRSGKGFISSALLLLLFILEIAMKFVYGTASVGWSIMYLAIIALLITGIRGTWAYRKYKDDPDIDVFD